MEARLAWEVGALVLCLNEESNGLFEGLLRVIALDTRFKIGRLYFILPIYSVGAALQQIFLICPCRQRPRWWRNGKTHSLCLLLV